MQVKPNAVTMLDHSGAEYAAEGDALLIKVSGYYSLNELKLAIAMLEEANALHLAGLVK